jgi:hypothetical protein
VTSTTIGTVGSAKLARVDPHGLVTPADARWSLDWWIGADDRWHRPADEPSARQSLVESVPVVRTAVRVPGGDAVQHAYAVGGDLAVVDVANESPSPFVLALVVRGARDLAVDGAIVSLDGRPALVTHAPPSRWAVGEVGTTEEVVRSGRAVSGPVPRRHERSGRLEAAFLYPVAHRATFRAALRLGSAGEPVDPARLPGPDDAVRGWAAQLGRGMQVELPDARLAGALRAARASALLEAVIDPVDPLVVAALEDWGFDAEAGAAWSRLGWRARRVAGRRTKEAGHWSDVAAQGGRGAPLLLAARSLLAHEDAAGAVTLLGDLPPGWRGQPITVHDAPTRAGPVSYAVRWHGPRPALLWEAPAGTTLRAPGLDPTWTTDEPRGDALLAARVA